LILGNWDVIAAWFLADIFPFFAKHYFEAATAVLKASPFKSMALWTYGFLFLSKLLVRAKFPFKTCFVGSAWEAAHLQFHDDGRDPDAHGHWLGRFEQGCERLWLTNQVRSQHPSTPKNVQVGQIHPTSWQLSCMRHYDFMFLRIQINRTSLIKKRRSATCRRFVLQPPVFGHSSA
jgi:hypothetical protein